MQIDTHDRDILRDVAKAVAEIAARPEMAARRARWVEHNTLRSKEPLLLVYPEGAWEELIPPSALRCQDEGAREIELELRKRVYTFAHFQDDTVIEAEWVVTAFKDWWNKNLSGWGLEPAKAPSSETRGAYRILPVLTEPADIKKLRYPELKYDPADHARRLEQASDLFSGILDVRRKGISFIAYHLMSQYMNLRGESAFLTDFIDAPDMLHEVLRFFTEGHKRLLAQMIELNLLSLNNDATYHSSGGNGYTDQLPAPGFDPQRVRPCDMWASAESQELAGVSPRMHREFALCYEAELLAPFGFTGYGCCEDLSRKMEDVLAVPNMRRVSVSPFADVERSAAALRDRAIYSWKPQPAHLTGVFDEPAIRAYIRRTLDVCRAHGCVPEIILKDTHTVEHHPERFDAWTRIAREEIERQ